MIRSLCRDVAKQIKSGNPTLMEIYKREAAEAKHEAKYWRNRFEGAMHEVLERYGANWDAGPILFDKDGEVF